VDISWGLTVVGNTVVGIGVTEFQCSDVDADCAESAEISGCGSKRPGPMPRILYERQEGTVS
jgi:hypothetical protein